MPPTRLPNPKWKRVPPHPTDGSPSESEAPTQLRRMVLANQLTLAALRAAIELGLADRIGTAARGSDDLARELGANPAYLYRLLRALTVPQIVEEGPDQVFRLLPLGTALRTDAPGSAAALVRFALQPYRARATEALAQGVLSGRVPMEIVHGFPHFGYLERNPADAAVFNAAMTSGSALRAQVILDTFDFSAARTVADVGGGEGMLLASILAPHPHLHGILFDLPQAIQGAPTLLESKGVADRCELVTGNFFERVPSGADTYLLSQILHDWDDRGAVRILQNVRHAVRDDGRILALDGLVPPGTRADPMKLMDLNMLIMLGGRERTEAEVSAVFRDAGFRLARVLPAPNSWAVFEGVPVAASKASAGTAE